MFNHLFVEMSTGYTSGIIYPIFTLMNGMQCYFTPMALDINTTTHPDRGSTVVKVLCDKSEGRWFDPS